MFSKGKQKSSSKFGAKPGTKSSSKFGATPTSKQATKPATKPGTKLTKVAPKNTTCAPMASASASPKAKKTENVSKKIPKGRTVQTRDEYLQGGYPKTGYENKGNYRKGIVVETNELDELAIIAATTSPKAKKIKNYDDKSAYKPYIETKDNNGKPIKISTKFVENSAKKDISAEAVGQILKDCNRYDSNRKKINDLKSRHKYTKK